MSRKQTLISVSLLVLGFAPALARTPSQSEWLETVTEEIASAEYRFSRSQDGAWTAPNRAQDLRVLVDPDGIAVSSRTKGMLPESGGWYMGLQLHRFGYESDMQALAPGSVETGDRMDAVEVRRDGLAEGYRNTSNGLRQELTLHRAPLGDGNNDLVFELLLMGSLGAYPADDGQSILLKTGSGAAVLKLGELVVSDSTGEPVPASLEVVTGGIRVRLDDRAAVYPIVAGVLFSSPHWTTESNQAGAQFGIAAHPAGDVNGDGYSDVIVGANLFDSGQSDEGKAFVYLGSPSGLSTTPAWTAESDQSGSDFAINANAAGDVNGDGYGDIAIGADLFNNGQSLEGAVFVWYGGPTGLGVNGNPSNADWRAESNQSGGVMGIAVGTAGDVNGDGYDDLIVSSHQYDNGQSNEGVVFVWFGGAAGLGANGTPLNADWSAEGDQNDAHLSFSPATAGDVNGDGYSDIIVSADLCDNGQSNEGAAFAWYGSAAGLGVTGTPANADWSAESNQTNGHFAISVSTAGDVNGDGYSDVIVGSDLFDNPETDEGRVFVYHGSPTGLQTTAAWITESNQGGAFYGRVVGTAGDANGDGYSDVIVGSYLYDSGEADEGKAFLYYGSASGLALTAGWTAESDQAGARLTHGGCQTAGDVNGDGYSDVIVGAYQYDGGQTNEGRAYAFLGSASGLATGPAWSTEGSQAGAQYGIAAQSAGDVNGDGYSDVIVGANLFDNGQTDEGMVFVFQGSSSGLSATASWTAESDQSDSGFGIAAKAAGDVNGDGYGDIVVAADLYDNGENDEGSVFVWYGSSTGLGPNGIPSNANWRAESNLDSEVLGIGANTAGDVNGDGYDDLIVSCHLCDTETDSEGRVFVWHGGADGLGDNGTPDNADWSAEGAQSGAHLGFSSGTAGDVNGDGYSDIIVSADLYDNGHSNEGAVFAWYGSVVGLGDNGTPENADWSAEADQVGAHFAISVATAGDVNGDGYSDVIVGSDLFDNGEANEGRAYVYHGSPTGLEPEAVWVTESNQVGAFYGRVVGTAGDVNGDGYSDVMVGSYLYDSGQADEGKAFLYYGSASGLALTAGWTAESDQVGARFTNAGCTTAGDVNGDGYSDVIIGSYQQDNLETDEGRAFLYYGNGGDGLDRIPSQARFGDMTPIGVRGSSDSNGVRLKALGRSPGGRTKVRLEWELKLREEVLDGSGLQQGTLTDTDAPGASGSVVPLDEPIDSLVDYANYHWRVRILSRSHLFPRSPWFTIASNKIAETDFRTPGSGNRPPRARAGAEQEVECNSPSGSNVLLDGTFSWDPDSIFSPNDDIVLYEWYEDFGLESEQLLGTSPFLGVTLPLGVHQITLKATDVGGQWDTDETTVTVVDTLAPTISTSLGPGILWPPNHRMVDVHAAVTASDVCGAVTVTLLSVTSSEPDNGAGDGDTVNDIQGVETGTADFDFALRAERASVGGGRLYSATYMVTDGSGNLASSIAFIFVLHDIGGVTDPIELLVQDTGGSTIVSWDTVLGATSYDVIRGELSSVSYGGPTIQLGPVVCIEDDSVDGSTAGLEDAGMPAPGGIFFYLVEYVDGAGSSSFGTESAGKPTETPTGGCLG